MKKLVDEFGSQVQHKLIVGGLRPGTTEPMDDAMKNTIRHHWEQVAKRSGQDFDYTFFDRDGFVYDTEPACRAVVAYRTLKPENSLAFFTSVQHAFYAEAQDVTQTEILSALAAKAGVSENDFMPLFESEECRNATLNDFAVAQQAGVSGFPTLFIGTNQEGFRAVTAGYQSYETLEVPLKKWVNEETSSSPASRPADDNNEAC